MCCYPRYEDDKLNKEPNTEFVIILSASWRIILSHKEKVANLDEVYNKLKTAQNLDVYKRNEIPDYLHYKKNKRALKWGKKI